MKILAMETSSALGGLALMDGEQLLEEMTAITGGRHSVRLLQEVDRLLRARELSARDVDLFVVSKGPGSFTGLRVGIATMKGLAYAAGRMAVGVSSLEVLAWPLRNLGCHVAAVMDARKGEVYGALYRTEGTGDGGRLHPVLPEMVASPGEWMRRVEQAVAETDGANGAGDGAPVVFVGDGVALLQPYLEERGSGIGVEVRLAGPEWNHPRPSVLSRVGLHKVQEAVTGHEQGEALDNSQVSPGYDRVQWGDASVPSCCSPLNLDANYIRPPDAVPSQPTRPRQGSGPVAD